MHVAILPFAEQSSIYDTLAQCRKFNIRPWQANVLNPTTDADHLWKNIDNVTVSNYICPSDMIASTHLLRQGTETRPIIYKSNYLPFTSGSMEKHMWKEAMTPEKYNPRVTGETGGVEVAWRAAFCAGKWRTMADFLDGLSNTNMVGEYLRGNTDRRELCNIWTARAGSQFINIVQTPNTTIADVNIYHTGFCRPEDGDNVPEMNLPCQEVAVEDPPQTTCAATRSRHAGGVNVLRGDASVSFVSSTISTTVFNAMGTIANGDSIQ